MTQEEIILCADASGISLFALGMDRKEFLRRLDVFANHVAAKKCEELAQKVERMPFGDTAASFALWIREQT